MIIVEGPDGAGKTKLVEHLADKYGFPVNERVVGTDTKPLIEDMKHWTEMNLRAGFQAKIFDRHRLISEPIYQAGMLRAPAPGFDDINWMTARHIELTRIRPFMAFCLPSYQAVRANIEDDPENQAIKAAMAAIYPAYVSVASGYVARGQAVHYNFQADPDYRRIDMLFELWIKTNRLRLTVTTLGKGR